MLSLSLFLSLSLSLSPFLSLSLAIQPVAIPNTTIPTPAAAAPVPSAVIAPLGGGLDSLLIDVAPPPPLDLAQSALPITNVAAAAAPTTSLTPGAEEGFQRSVQK